MSFPSLQVRPNEKNPTVLRAHEFLRQSNELVERNIVNVDGRKLLAKSLSKMVSEVKAIYARDEKNLEAGKSAKMLEKLKVIQENATSVQEDRFVIAELQRKVLEKQIENQKLISEIDSARDFVRFTKAEIQRKKEKLEERRKFASEATETLKSRSLSILKHLEASEEGENLRKVQNEKRMLEDDVEKLRSTDERLKQQIQINIATLKAESKKSFKNTVIECAKHYRLCQTLAPKLERSLNNVEKLKEEEERRKASGSIDDTVLFDRSFVLASMEKEKKNQKATLRTVQNDPPVSPPVPEPETPTVAPQPIQVEKPSFDNHVDSVVIEPFEPVVQEVEQVMEESKETEEEEPMDVPESIVDNENHENSTINISEISGNVSMHEEAPGDDSDQNSEPFERISMETQRVIHQPETPEDEVDEVLEKEHSIDVMADDNVEEEPMELETPAAKNTQTSTSKPVDSFTFNMFHGSPNKDSENSGSGANKSNEFDFGNMFGGMGGSDDASNNGSAFDFIGGGAGGNENSNADPFGFGASSGGAAGAGDASFQLNFDGTGNNGGGNDNEGNFFNF